MMSFNRTVLFIFIVHLSIFCRLINSQATTNLSSLVNTNDTDETTNYVSSTTISMIIDSIVNSTMTLLPNNSTNTSMITPTTTITSVSSSLSNSSTSTNSSFTSTIDNVRPPDGSSGPGWWLLVALLITIVIVIIVGLIFYYRQHSPYRRSISCLQWCRQCKYRFLRNWRSRDDDADNIILQLEQPEITNGQWPPRISFT